MNIKTFKLQMKEFDESKGTFTGYASVFGNKDLQGDVVDMGAFKKTIDEGKGKVPILDQHNWDWEIGITTELSENSHGLWFKGQLYLDEDPRKEVPRAREVYAKLLHRMKYEKPLGISIGFDIVKDTIDEGIRHLKELRLWEISTVTFPANQLATATDVKQFNALMKQVSEPAEGIDPQTIEQAIKSLQAMLKSTQAPSEPAMTTHKDAGAAEIDALLQEIKGMGASINRRHRLEDELQTFAKQLMGGKH